MEKKDYSEIPNNFIDEIICGNCIELIKEIPDRSIDAVITDPPYGLNKYGVKNDTDLGLYYYILPECFRALKDDSFFVTFFSTKYLPLAFENNPFTFLWQVVLYCPEGSVRSPIGFTKFMSCLVFKKGKPKLQRLNKDIFVDTPGKMVEPDEGYIDHPTPKPKTFVKELLKMFTAEGDIVLDPFVGSGSTALACQQLNRHFIGFEIEERYCKIAKSRLMGGIHGD